MPQLNRRYKYPYSALSYKSLRYLHTMVLTQVEDPFVPSSTNTGRKGEELTVADVVEHANNITTENLDTRAVVVDESPKENYCHG